MKRLLSLALLASACGLDDFSWGGPTEACDVAWVMAITEHGGGTTLEPEVSRVERDGDRVTWLARQRLGGQKTVVRFTITGPRLDVRPIDGPPAPDVVLSSACSYEESPSGVRERPLARWTCTFRAQPADEMGGVPVPAPDPEMDEVPDLPPEPIPEAHLLVLEEVDRCSE